MRRLGSLAAAGTFLVAALVVVPASAAEAHVLTVTPPGTGETLERWVGVTFETFLVVDGSPAADNPGPVPDVLFSSHALGLNAACEGTEANEIVDIRGPGGPGCPHGE
jgi:hypothetical protein